MKRFFRSFGYAGKGLRYAASGKNFKFDIVCAVAVVALARYLCVSREDWAILILTIGFVLMAEATNSAIEEICNKFHPETHPHIALIKDLAAGAVLISAIAAAIVGAFIFLPYFF